MSLTCRGGKHPDIWKNYGIQGFIGSVDLVSKFRFMASKYPEFG